MGFCLITFLDAVSIEGVTETNEVKEAADISGAPGRQDREHDTQDDATGHGWQAQSDAMEQAPGKAGRPGKGSPQVEGGDAPRGQDLGRTQYTADRASDAESPGRRPAKNRHPRVIALIRRYGWRVQEG